MEKQPNENKIRFELFRVQVQHGAHEDGGFGVAGERQVDQSFKLLMITEAVKVDQAVLEVLISILSRM